MSANVKKYLSVINTLSILKNAIKCCFHVAFWWHLFLTKKCKRTQVCINIDHVSGELKTYVSLTWHNKTLTHVIQQERENWKRCHLLILTKNNLKAEEEAVFKIPRDDGLEYFNEKNKGSYTWIHSISTTLQKQW